MNSFAAHIINFYYSLKQPTNLPKDIEVLFPQSNPEVVRLIEVFYKKYYSDNNKRRLIFGINPGRYGAGSTGINFTATKQLMQYCGIECGLKSQTELSAEFIYEMIMAYAGCEKFYGDYFLTAISPLGFIKNGKNINYYDDKKLLEAVTPFIVKCINEQTSWNVYRDKCFCIGEDKNYKFLSSLNEKHEWFEEIVALPHPRFIMQYRRKRKDEFVSQYLQALKG